MQTDELAHLDAIISCKRSPRKERLQSLRPRLAGRFAQYSQALPALESLSPSVLLDEAKSDCLHCYDEETHGLAELRRIIVQGVPTLCQWCYLSRWSELDHFAPKDRFPEFAVFASNLAPCCSQCNKDKGNYWPVVGGSPEILSLYYARALALPHLKCRIDYAGSGAVPVPVFRIESDTLQPAEVERLVRHYGHMKLMPRLHAAASDFVAECKGVLVGQELLPVDGRAWLQDHAKWLMVHHGQNYPFALVELAVADCPGLIEDWCALQSGDGRA